MKLFWDVLLEMLPLLAVVFELVLIGWLASDRYEKVKKISELRQEIRTLKRALWLEQREPEKRSALFGKTRQQAIGRNCGEGRSEQEA